MYTKENVTYFTSFFFPKTQSCLVEQHQPNCVTNHCPKQTPGWVQVIYSTAFIAQLLL